MAIGSLDRAGRLAQLRVYAAVQVRGGYRSDAEVRADVREAVAFEVGEGAEAVALADEFVDAAAAELRAEAATWPQTTGFDRLRAAFADLETAGVAVLEAVDDHWAAQRFLDEREAAGTPPLGVAFFTHTDVWHAVEHKMLEINLWHGNGANVADSDELLTLVKGLLTAHGLPAAFDEGRIEVTVRWQRRPLV